MLQDSVKQTVDLQTYKQFFFNGDQFEFLSIVYLLLGAIVCFFYVALNKYYSYYSQQEVVDPEANLTKQKFENLSLIKHLKFKSIIFNICFSYGLFATLLFVGIALLDLANVTDTVVSEDLLVSTGIGWIDGIIGGLVFGFALYPVLSTRIIGTFGFDWLIDLFANPNDKRIQDEITIARYLEISSLIRDLEKKTKGQGGSYSINEFGNQLITWNDHLDKVDDDILLLTLDDAKEKHNDHLVNISLSIAKTIGFENMRMALKYPVY